jgi:hypothetical protein
VDAGKWDFLAFDTAVSPGGKSCWLTLIICSQSSGGPPLIFDHGMAVDCEAQILYVFGGRLVSDWETPKSRTLGFTVMIFVLVYGEHCNGLIAYRRRLFRLFAGCQAHQALKDILSFPPAIR